LNARMPEAFVAAVGRLISRATIGDLTRYGMPAPQDSVVEYHRRTDVVPILDVGLVAQLRAGRIQPVPEVVGFEGGDVLVGSDRHRVQVDAVIAATGYRTGLEPLVGHLDVLDAHGRPVVTGATCP